MDRAATKDILTTAIKKEALNDDIKEFAETAMNEVLGWYGYGSSNSNSQQIPPNSTSVSGSNSSDPESPNLTENCGWCGKPVEENAEHSSASSTFCSELCFSQSRRANFKKNKTCDWCRHLRHTVSYVDSQDESLQLQFCSDKCLNQYKMHIFWRETRAHLEIHPHIHDDESSNGLITPDLWMKKCKSPDNKSKLSISSSKLESYLKTPPSSSLIKVVHPSKLSTLPPKEPEMVRQKSKVQKKCRKKINPPLENPILNDMPQDLRIKQTPISDTKQDNLSKTNPVLTQAQETKNVFSPFIPPPTIMLPYPVILPLPIPIPIPFPINLTASKENLKNAFSQTESNTQTDSTIGVDIDSCKAITIVNTSKRKRKLVGKKLILKRKK